MAELKPLQGELQTQVMAALWRLGSGTVEQVRSELPQRYRGAYNTIQTVLNRLADRQLLEREREGRGMCTAPRSAKPTTYRRTIRRTLSGASSSARQAALANLIGGPQGGRAAGAAGAGRQAKAARRTRRS